MELRIFEVEEIGVEVMSVFRPPDPMGRGIRFDGAFQDPTHLSTEILSSRHLFHPCRDYKGGGFAHK